MSSAVVLVCTLVIHGGLSKMRARRIKNHSTLSAQSNGRSMGYTREADNPTILSLKECEYCGPVNLKIIDNLQEPDNF